MSGSWIHRAGLVMLCLASQALAAPEAEGLPIGPAASDVVKQGETKSHSLEIDEPGEVGFMLFYGSGNLNLAIVSPDGEVFDSTSAVVRKESFWDESPFPFGGIMEAIMVPQAKAGGWTARVTGARIEEPSGVMLYTVSVLAEQVVQLEAKVVDRGPGHIVGDRLRIRATLTKGGTPIPGASVFATVESPDEDRTELRLADDGAAPDSAAGDGVYTAEFDKTVTSGHYEILVKASGKLAGTDRSFERVATPMAIVARSHREEDRLAALEERHPGPLEPPIEIRVQRPPERCTESCDYVYTVSNGSPFPIVGFHIGSNARTGRGTLRVPPTGWEEHRTPERSYRAPAGWRLSFSTDIESLGTLMWNPRSSKDSVTVIGSGQTSEFRVSLPRPDRTYEHSDWMAFVTSSHGGSYEGTLVASGAAPTGEPMQRLGGLEITLVDAARVRVRCHTATPVRPQVAILNSAGKFIQGLPQPDKPGTDHEFEWNGRDAAGREVPGGSYFVLVKYGNTERFGRLTWKP